MKTSDTEKRKNKRSFCKLPIHCSPFGPGEVSSSKEGLTKDISEGGLRLIVHKFIPVATNMVLNLKLSTLPRILKAVSKVVWIRKLPGGEERYEAGVTFTDISNGDRREIKAFVDAKESSPSKENVQESEPNNQ
ncbi:TPA: hypothetical protein DCX15_06465 [bacterium]|nr:hypothetical protein [bacterium]